RIAGASQALDEITGQSRSIRLYRRQVGEVRKIIGIGVDETQTGCAEGPEIVHPSVVNCESSSNRKVVEVPSELRIMSADSPGEIVSKLVTLFDPLNIRVGLASEESEAGNVH